MRYVFPLAILLATLLAAATPQAQQAIAGTTFYFDHAQADFDDTEVYQLCVDAVSDAACVNVGVVLVTAAAPLNTYKFTLPASVPRGNHSLAVRAVGKLETGASAGSNALAVRIIGKPGPPLTFRQTP